MILARTPCSRTVYLTKTWATSAAVAVVLRGMKCATLVSLSTTTKIESNPSETLGNPVKKSMLMHSHFISGISRGWSFPSNLTRSALTFWQIKHRFTCSRVSFFNFGQKNFCFKEAYILWYPWWAARGDSCASLRIWGRRLMGIHKRSRKYKSPSLYEYSWRCF